MVELAALMQVGRHDNPGLLRGSTWLPSWELELGRIFDITWQLLLIHLLALGHDELFGHFWQFYDLSRVKGGDSLGKIFKCCEAVIVSTGIGRSKHRLIVYFNNFTRSKVGFWGFGV